jgi:hypothetical protein
VPAASRIRPSRTPDAAICTSLSMPRHIDAGVAWPVTVLGGSPACAISPHRLAFCRLENFSAYSPWRRRLTPAMARARPGDLQKPRNVAKADGLADRSLRIPLTRHTASLTCRFTWWQVLGSNQRRLSRRFYRGLPVKITYSLWPAETRILRALSSRLNHSSTESRPGSPGMSGRHWLVAAVTATIADPGGAAQATSQSAAAPRADSDTGPARSHPGR